MKADAFLALKSRRLRIGRLASSDDDGNNGAFGIPGPEGVLLFVIASDGAGWSESGLPGPPWEHVSVSTERRCPTWLEMDFIKRKFWRDDETVIQFHVPLSEHVNYHLYCLHMWKPIGVDIPRPPMATVGPRT